MSDNGTFIKKKGFTIAGNSMVRDTHLSLKAKGLYLLIMSFITLENLELTKDFLQKKCAEGTKAFSSTWDELKKAGYLKVHMTPGKQGWRSEYELLDEAVRGEHTYYHSNDGAVSSTNLTRTHKREQTAPNYERTPQKGIYADSSNANGVNADGVYANGGNNIKTSYKTTDNTKNKSLSIYQRSQLKYAHSNEAYGLSDDDLREIVEADFRNDKVIPYQYKTNERKMLAAIRILTHWYERTTECFTTDFQKTVFDMFVECLTEMACADEIQTYKGASVSYAKIIEQINDIINRDGSLYHYGDETIDDYITAASEYEIKDKRKYMKSVIWNSFLTYQVKFESFFARTYGK